ncbi:M23 family metallopeptidase [Candidatus Synechococcus spongiarum]|uniref:M23 family metallopeptidase n=1 Tax=Candidatus Synechococcus spongiarum TaxID=431041 RepID=UPI0009430984|nr:M23 family metallopeptidase [Candidatus Synechococcus spongiarum]
MRSLFKLTVASTPILAAVALLSASTLNPRAAIENLQPRILQELVPSTSPSGKQDHPQYLIWMQLGQDGSHLALAEALNLPLQTLLHFNGVTKSQPLKRGSWISLPALFKSHLEAYTGPWINPSSLREEPPESLTTSATLAQREETVFEDQQTLIWIQLAENVSYEELASQIKMSPDILRWINGGWRDENPLAQGSWISVPQDWRLMVKYAISLDLLTLRDTPPPGVAFYTTVPGRGERIHIVAEGEKLTTISPGDRLLATIHALNPGLGDQDLQPGLRIKVPMPDRNSQHLAARPGVAGLSWPNQTLADHQQELRFDTRWSWPTLSGLVTSGYGWRWGRMHNGIDISDHVGTPVLAAADGQVKRASWHHNGYGYLVELTHSDGSLTRYAHNSRILVKPGQTVRRGQIISEIGCTGRCTGPHLHFEIHPTGRGAADPLALLPRR